MNSYFSYKNIEPNYWIMNYRICFSILFFCFTIQKSFSQTSEDFTKRFNQGKTLFNKAKYGLAKESFSQLINPDPSNPYTEYAYYYCALSDFKAGKPEEAKLFLTKLLSQYPDWSKRDEAIFLISNISFDQNDPNLALSNVNNIKSPYLKDDIKNLKRLYLNKQSLSSLKELKKKYDNDEVLAEILYFQLKKADSKEKEDIQLLKHINKQYDFASKSEPEPVNEIKNNAQILKTKKKEVYNVAVLFPFSMESIDKNKSVRSNQLVLDMYEGILIAKQELEKQNIKLKISAFDIGKDANPILDLVNQSEFENTDLIIGPLYPQSNQVAVAFANEKKIALVNPLSSNAKLLENNPYAFLIKPSHETRAIKAAEYVYNNFPSKPGIIIYGTTEEDSILAFTYKQKFTDLGGKILLTKKVGTGEISQMKTALNGYNDKTLGHIFMASGNAKVVSGFMNVLENNSYKIPTITPSNWFNFELMNFNQFEQRNIYFIYPEYLDTQAEEVKKFKHSYLQKTNIVPSLYAYQGYDMMLFFGRLMGENGSHFDKILHERKQVKSIIFSGYDYQKANDNQYVPIYKFEEGDFKLLNPIE